ncbi:MAG: hypothetical protein U9Q15_03890 [Patescibacteria group bacterium]|nr:hypothetical protein [Patescibacteria group bacterium]
MKRIILLVGISLSILLGVFSLHSPWYKDLSFPEFISNVFIKTSESSDSDVLFDSKT